MVVYGIWLVAISLRSFFIFFLIMLRPPISTLFPYTTLFRSCIKSVATWFPVRDRALATGIFNSGSNRSEEHTSELQSRQYLVCRLLLEKKKRLERIEQFDSAADAVADTLVNPTTAFALDHEL